MNPVDPLELEPTALQCALHLSASASGLLLESFRTGQFWSGLGSIGLGTYRTIQLVSLSKVCIVLVLYNTAYPWFLLALCPSSSLLQSTTIGDRIHPPSLHHGRRESASNRPDQRAHTCPLKSLSSKKKTANRAELCSGDHVTTRCCRRRCRCKCKLKLPLSKLLFSPWPAI